MRARRMNVSKWTLLSIEPYDDESGDISEDLSNQPESNDDDSNND